MKAPNLIKGTASSYPGVSSQTDVTASRALDATAYHNTSTKPILCVVSVLMPQNGACGFRSDNTVSPSLVVASIYNVNSQNVTSVVSFWVLPGNYYRGTSSGGATLSTWIEYS